MRLALAIGALAAVLMVSAGEAMAQRATGERPQAAEQRHTRPVQPSAAASARAQPARPAVAPRQHAARPDTSRAAAQAARGTVFRSATAATTAGMPRTATAACARRDTQGRCLRPATATPRWQTGLPPMTMAQQECPPGTVATLARGHADVVRCLPI
jgi:hypothetical protein